MMKKNFVILNLLCIIILSCSKGDDGGGSTPITQTQEVVVPNPGKSTLLLPVNNEVCYDGEDQTGTNNSVVKFSWNVSADTDGYELVVTNQESNQAQTIVGITTTSKNVTLVKGDPYSWKVVSKSNGTNVTTNSDTWQFNLEGPGDENHVPFIATIISPSSGSTVNVTDGAVLLNWEGNDPDQDDTLTYTVYFDSTDGLQSPSTDQTKLTLSSLSVNVVSGITYYWRVKTTDGTSSSYTLAHSFIVN
jgi:hypothetical protein